MESLETLLGDEYFMKQALLEAKKAFEKGEIPIGVVVVSRERIIARGHNLTETLGDVTAHAEMQAITSAASSLGGKYLKDCTLYVTIEPCVMCAGALYWSQIDRVVYGATDPKKGYTTTGINLLHPGTRVVHGIMASECGDLMTAFFKARRK